jgi:hypothetical protein
LELEKEPAIEKPSSATDTESEEEDNIVGERYCTYLQDMRGDLSAQV